MAYRLRFLMYPWGYMNPKLETTALMCFEGLVPGSILHLSSILRLLLLSKGFEPPTLPLFKDIWDNLVSFEKKGLR